MIHDYTRIANCYLTDIKCDAEIDFYESLEINDNYDTFLEKLKKHELYKIYITEQLINNHDTGLWDINVGLQETVNNLWEVVKDEVNDNGDTHRILCEV